MVEMGGASTQIANFENDGDLMVRHVFFHRQTIIEYCIAMTDKLFSTICVQANLFKLQLGGSRHWNVYVHSYLYFGINGAWSRLNSYVHWKGSNVNPCLPLGSSVEFESWMHMNDNAQWYPRSHPKSTPYAVTMLNNGTKFDYKSCSEHTNDLLRKRTNRDWCDFQMDGNCAFAGIYQPPMPKVNSPGDRFIATSNFYDVYDFLRLEEESFVHEIGTAAEHVCNLSWEELKVYNSENRKPISTDLVLAQMCFRSTFVYQLLRNGWEFGDNYKMTAVDVINGQKLGWALGCMLYEINTRKLNKSRRIDLLTNLRKYERLIIGVLFPSPPTSVPWNFHPEFLYRGPSKLVIALYVIMGTLLGSAAGFVIAMRFSKSFNKRVRESVFFRGHPELYQNPGLRKSLKLPEDYTSELSDLDHLYETDERKDDEPVNEKNGLLSQQSSGH